jgi:hypothetical protein
MVSENTNRKKTTATAELERERESNKTSKKRGKDVNGNKLFQEIEHQFSSTKIGGVNHFDSMKELVDF